MSKLIIPVVVILATIVTSSLGSAQEESGTAPGAEEPVVQAELVSPENLTSSDTFTDYTINIYRDKIGAGCVKILKAGKEV